MMAVGPLDQGCQQRIKGLQDSLDPTRAAKSSREAMQREGAKEWAEELKKE
jgi:hypothetical protein